jgi:hypothetical protein
MIIRKKRKIKKDKDDDIYDNEEDYKKKIKRN